MVTNPVTCSPDDTLADVERLCATYRISGVPVTDESGVLVGIVTNRDMRFETDQQPSGARGHDADAAGHRAGRGLAGRRVRPAQAEQDREAAAGRRRRPAARAHHGQGLHQERAVSAGHQGRRRPAGGRRGRRRRGRRREAGQGADRGRRRRDRRGRRARPLQGPGRHDRQDQGQQPGSTSSAATSPPGRAPRCWSTPGADAVKVGVGPGLHLHHPRGRRGRRAAGHGHLRGLAGRRPGRGAGDRRRRPAILRRHRQGHRGRAPTRSCSGRCWPAARSRPAS